MSKEKIDMSENLINPEQEKIEKIRKDIQAALEKFYRDEIEHDSKETEDKAFSLKEFDSAVGMFNLLTKSGIDMSALTLTLKPSGSRLTVEVYYKDLLEPIFKETFATFLYKNELPNNN